MLSAENVSTFLFLLGMSVFCWLMVLKPSLREKFGRSRSRLWRLRKEDYEGWDAMMLAGYLVGAMSFSLLTLVLIFIGFYRSIDR